MAIYQGEPLFEWCQRKNRLDKTPIYQVEPAQEPAGTSYRDAGNQCGPLGPLVPVLALTAGQSFVFAILGLVSVVVFVVLPAVYGTKWDRRHADDKASGRRLLRELRKHE